MDNRKEQVVITGVGLVSPLGLTLKDFFTGLIKKTDVYRDIKVFDSLKAVNPKGMQVEECSLDYRPEEIILNMGECAIRSAIADRGLDTDSLSNISLVFGSGLGLTDQLYFEDKDIHYLSSLGERLCGRLGLKCEIIYIANACCAGSQAVCYGVDLLRYTDTDLVIAGGLDILSQAAYAGFQRLNAIDPDGCRPFDRERKGISVGEGAAFFTMERNTPDLNKNRKVYCAVTGFGMTNDAYHVVQLKPDGLEIIRAMDEAVQSSGLSKDDIDLIVAHGTGTAQNDRVESSIIRTYFNEQLEHIHVTTPKGAIGHTGGASGAFGIATAIGSIIYGEVPSVTNLKTIDENFEIPLVFEAVKKTINTVMVNAFAFGGTNIVVICKSINEESHG